MKRSIQNLSAKGFTIIELLVIIVIIGILATFTLVAYNGIQNSARDKSVQSDIDNLDGIETDYGNKNNVIGKAWYSGNGVDSSLNFTPSTGNVIDVVINGTSYCIRGYNIAATTYKSISTAAIKESTSGVCAGLAASAAAIAASP
jgi:prepilin-type N-terminal cleavage/methylation domain-containing protein